MSGNSLLADMYKFMDIYHHRRLLIAVSHCPCF